MNPDSISFVTPVWLIVYYHLIGTISLITGSFCVYLIIFKSDKLGTFKHYLLWFQISCILTDVSLTLLLQPVTLLPMWALYQVGYSWQLFRLNFRESTMPFVLWIGQLFAALVFCFLVKHQSICSLDNKFIMSRFFFNAFLIVAQFVIVCFVMLFFKAQNDQKTASAIAREIYPSMVAKFEKLPSFQVFAKNETYPVFLGLCALAGAFVIFLIILSTFHMIRVLNENRKKMSGASFLRQKQAVKSLVAQFLTAGLALLPPVVCFALIILEPNFSQVISLFMCAVFSTHSTVTCFVMVSTSPEYRKIVLNRMKNRNVAPVLIKRVQSASFI